MSAVFQKIYIWEGNDFQTGCWLPNRTLRRCGAYGSTSLSVIKRVSRRCDPAYLPSALQEARSGAAMQRWRGSLLQHSLPHVKSSFSPSKHLSSPLAELSDCPSCDPVHWPSRGRLHLAVGEEARAGVLRVHAGLVEGVHGEKEGLRRSSRGDPLEMRLNHHRTVTKTLETQ